VIRDVPVVLDQTRLIELLITEEKNETTYETKNNFFLVDGPFALLGGDTAPMVDGGKY
jgi:hypothetical protein